MKCIRWGALLASFGIAADVFCALVLSGCVGATRVPSRVHDPTGVTIEKNNIDLDFLQAGTTRREEVVDKLSRIDTGCSNPRMFWGRWSESKWGHWAVGISGGEVARDWHVHNLLISFDQNGVMQTKELTDDERVLERELRAQLATAPPLDLSQPVPITLTPTHLGNYEENPIIGLIDMTLTKDGKIVRGAAQPHSRDAKSPIVQISVLKVARISYDSYHGNKSSSGSICHDLHLTEKSPIGKSILFCTSAVNLATIFQYFRQAGLPTCAGNDPQLTFLAFTIVLLAGGEPGEPGDRREVSLL